MNSSILPAFPKVFFDDLRLGPSSQSLLTRVIRYWEVDNPTDGADNPALTILMIDEKGSLTHAFIPPNLRDAYYGALREGGIYKIFHFEVSNSTKLYKLTSSPFVIMFTPATSFSQFRPRNINMPRESFDVHTYDQLMGIANTGLALPDVVGKICNVEGPDLFNPICMDMITVVLCLQPDVITTLNLWDKTAAALRNLIHPPNCVKPLILVTAVNPNIIGGRLTLDSTMATRFFFTNNFAQLNKYGESFGPEEDLTFQINDTTKLVRKVENVSIKELINFTMQPGHTNAEFLCESMVFDVTCISGPNYSSGSSGAPNMAATQTSQLWWDRPTHNFLGDDKMHVAVKVFDGSSMATFILTETELKEYWSPANTHTTFPQENGVRTEANSEKVNEMVGQIFLFKIRINPYNYSTSEKTFSVAKIQRTLTESKPNFGRNTSIL